MVVSPDVGGVVRARALAKRIDAPLAIVDKRRERAGDSEVMNIIGDVAGKTCILVDDIVDSGDTLCNAADVMLRDGLSWATLRRKWRFCTWIPKRTRLQLLIRSPKVLHVRKHWHSANEMHTVITGTATFACDGKKAEFGPGGFNYMPARLVHEAWVGAGSVTFITARIWAKAPG
jgi:hypoxanthine phosphoribosyltransferase